MRPSRTLLRGVIALAVLAGAGLGAAAEHEPLHTEKVPPPPEKPGQIQAEPPPFTPGIFPCTNCHQGAGDATRRELAFHDDIKFEHGVEHRWCLDCHTNDKRDVLHLSDGTLVPFTESYKLCGQCHGDKYRDWRAGVHGKRTGQWDGQKTYYLCVNCHNPHSPKFKPLKPEPKPVRPEEMRR
ncbi:MAG TPA: hypothetical protein VFP65_20430 [Anaeromyxobacteraceae bacterium]|nr:hypothetical protein [Anaeromyxobacteraceae bacterium]